MPYLSTTTFFTAVGAASAQFSATLPEGTEWQVGTSTNAWIRFDSTNPTASKAAGSIYVSSTSPANIIVPPGGCKVAIIQDSAGGNASLTLMPA